MRRSFDLASGLSVTAAWEEELERFDHHADTSYACDLRDFKDGWSPKKTLANDDQKTGIFDLEGGSLRLVLNQHEGRVSVGVAAESAQRAQEIISEVEADYPRIDGASDRDFIRATFWAYGSHGPSSYNRRLSSQSWDDVRGNYSGGAQKLLDWLTSDEFSPGEGGQLVLWHGPPGTGKTTAIRALLSEWREWAELHYITDPEKFFGTHSDYMLRVMLEAGDDLGESEDRDTWRILVLEDASELLGASAKADVGPALQRFLNAVDGMIGQGLRVLVLATTNEEVGRWHEAVTRPGRTVARVEFPELTAHEADRWRSEHELEKCGEAASLADLYSELAESRAPEVEERRTVGFA